MTTSLLLAHLIAWGGLAVLLYAYFGYPLLLARCRKGRGNSGTVSELPSRELPTVTVVVAAYNEAAVIGAKIENTLSQHYPLERLDLMVISDGSTDDTDRIVEEYAARTGRVRLLHTGGREGKSLALNLAVPQARGELVVLTDANAMFHEDAVARWFALSPRPKSGR